MKKNWLPFEEAREIVRKLGLKSHLDWRKYCKNHKGMNIPVSAGRIYKDCGWISMKHWLGVDNEKGSRLATKTHNIKVTHSLIVNKYWDYNKNIKNPEDICPNARETIHLKCDKDHEWTLHAYSLGRFKGCPYCMHKRIIREESFGYSYPYLLKYWDYEKNIIDPYEVYGGASHKVHLKCGENHEWQRKIEHIVNRGDNCPYCTHSKIKLRDGTICDSMVEAYYCLLLKQSEIKFDLNHCYPELSLRYDFYIPSLNLYIEVTSYNASITWWNSYSFKIKTKKDHVENKLGGNFEFINRSLSTLETRFVMENMV